MMCSSVLEKMLELNFDPFALDSAGKGEDLTDDVGAALGADL